MDGTTEYEYRDAVELAEQYLREHPDQEPYRARIIEHARRIGTVRRPKCTTPLNEEAVRGRDD